MHTRVTKKHASECCVQQGVLAYANLMHMMHSIHTQHTIQILHHVYFILIIVLHQPSSFVIISIIIAISISITISIITNGTSLLIHH